MTRLHGIARLALAAGLAAVLGGNAFSQQTATGAQGIADRKNYLADLAVQLKRTWPGNRTINVVCHGHSVPAGYFKTPLVDSFNAYPHLIHRGLKERYPNAVINVIVTAIGGEASESGAARFERDVLAHQPDLVLIDYALNDRGLGLDRAKAAWKKMIEKAQARGVKVILVTPTGYLGRNSTTRRRRRAGTPSKSAAWLGNITAAWWTPGPRSGATFAAAPGSKTSCPNPTIPIAKGTSW